MNLDITFGLLFFALFIFSIDSLIGIEVTPVAYVSFFIMAIILMNYERKKNSLQ